MSHPPRTDRLVRAAVGAALCAVLLVGCTSAPDPEPTTSPSPSVSATPTPTAPALQPDGSAEDNLPYFTTVIEEVWGAGSPVDGRTYIDALTAAGFDKAAMQVTNDLTSLGGPVDSIQFSVLWKDECLIGQVGPAIGEPVATTGPRVSGGACLIGQTRTIDW